MRASALAPVASPRAAAWPRGEPPRGRHGAREVLSVRGGSVSSAKAVGPSTSSSHRPDGEPDARRRPADFGTALEAAGINRDQIQTMGRATPAALRWLRPSRKRDHAHRGHLHRRRGLTGKIINTNFSYMSQKLEDVGLAVLQWETTVGDDRESLLLASSSPASGRMRSSSTGPSGRRWTTCRGSRPSGRCRARAERGMARHVEDFFKRRSRHAAHNVKQPCCLRPPR